MLRREFAIEKRVRRAVIYYSGLGLSELWLNGAKVGDHVLSPGLTNYDKHVLYEAFDVTRLLTRGRNAAGLWLGNGRFHAPRFEGPTPTRNFGDPKAILQLNIEYEDGTTTGGLGRLLAASPPPAPSVPTTNTTAKSTTPAWKSPTGAARLQRGLVATRECRCPPAGTLVSQTAEPLRVTETIKPVSVKKPPRGSISSTWARTWSDGPAFTSPAPGHRRYPESRRNPPPDGSLYTDNLRSARAADTLHPQRRGHGSLPAPLHLRGFRYVEVAGFPGDPDGRSLEGRVVHDDMERPADFTSSNDLSITFTRTSSGDSRQLPQYPHRLPAARRAAGLARRPLPGKPQ